MLYLPDRQPHFTFLLAPTLQVKALASMQLRDNVSEIEHNCWTACLCVTIMPKQWHLFPKWKMQLWPCDNTILQLPPWCAGAVADMHECVSFWLWAMAGAVVHCWAVCMPLGLQHTDMLKLLKYDSVPGSATNLLFFPVYGWQLCRGTAGHGGGTRRPKAGQGRLHFLLKPTGQETSLSTFCNLSLVTCPFTSPLPETEGTAYVHLGCTGESPFLLWPFLAVSEEKESMDWPRKPSVCS